MQRIKTLVKIFKNPRIEKTFSASVINVESENEFTTLLFIMQYVMLFFVLNGRANSNLPVNTQCKNSHTILAHNAIDQNIKIFKLTN
jgi:hypothetical protein